MKLDSEVSERVRGTNQPNGETSQPNPEVVRHFACK